LGAKPNIEAKLPALFGLGGSLGPLYRLGPWKGLQLFDDRFQDAGIVSRRLEYGLNDRVVCIFDLLGS